MFYCELCRVENQWPASFGRSYGQCEICQESDLCHDVPTAQLPLPKRVTTKTQEDRLRIEIQRLEKRAQYWLTVDGIQRPVSKEEFVLAERAAGFHNTSGHPNEPATSGFSDRQHQVSGQVTYLPEERHDDFTP